MMQLRELASERLIDAAIGARGLTTDELSQADTRAATATLGTTSQDRRVIESSSWVKTGFGDRTAWWRAANAVRAR
jgi:hypothetical protein